MTDDAYSRLRLAGGPQQPVRPPQRHGGRAETVVFDLGGVLVEWDPRHLYREVFDDPDEMERFLAEVCTWEWHHHHDAGVLFEESIPALSKLFPEQSANIALWESRYMDMIPGEVPGTVDVLRDLKARGTRVLALTNMPVETEPQLRARFDWFELFEGVIVSGREKLVKPDPAIYRILIDRFGVDPSTTAFVDDRPENIDAANALGFQGILFTDADALRRVLGR